MNAETLQLVEKLAAKLGTTSEYLWGVLLKQAPITAIINAIEMVAMAALIYYLWRKLLRTEFTGYDALTAKVILYISMTVFTAAAGIGITCSFETVITAAINPEYWALKQIIK